MIDYQQFDSIDQALKSDAPHVHLSSPEAILSEDILQLADRDTLKITTTDKNWDGYYDGGNSDLEEVPFSHNLPLLSQLPNLKALHLHSEHKFNELPTALMLLVELEELELSLYVTRYDQLLGLTSLQSLNLNFRKNNLKKLLKIIPKIETLKRLCLKSNLNDIPKPIIQLQQLEHLSILKPDSDNFHNIIKQLCKMRHLKSLSLQCDSHVHELPEEIIGLDFLEHFEMQFPKSTKNLRLPQAFLDHPKPFVTTTQSNIQRHYEILQSVKELPEATKDLIKAINIDNRKLLSELIPNPFDQDFQAQKAVFFLAGRTNKMGFTKKELQEKLQEYGIKVSTKLTDKVTHLLLGSAIKSNVIDHIVHHPDLKLVLDDHFRQYVLDQDEGFLKEDSEDLNEKVLALLLNPNPTNAIIGINMLETGGINSPVFLTIVMLLSTLAKDKEVRKSARKVFNQNASESLKDTLKKEKKNLKKVVELQKELYQHAELDMPTYLVLASYLNGYPLFRSMPLDAIPPVVKYFRNIRDISLIYKEIDIHQAMDLLVQIPDIKSIELIDTALKEVPAKLSSMHSLESIRINYGKVTTIPKSITALPNLKTLDISSNQLQEINLSGLPKLEAIYMSCNKLTSFCLDLPNVTRLNISHNHIKDISTIELLPSLQHLSLEHNHITDLSPLKKLKNLVTICFDPNPDMDYKILRELSNPSFDMQVPYLIDYEYMPLWYVLRYKSLKRFKETETIIDPTRLKEVWDLIRTYQVPEAEKLAISEGWDMEIFQMYCEL